MLKPLTDYQKRSDSRDGYRKTCKDCRKRSKNATNRRWYEKYKDREQQKQRRRRQANLMRFRSRDALYALTNKEKLSAKNRKYYRRNREVLISRSLERRKRFQSLDFGWGKGLAHDRVQEEVWVKSQDVKESQDMLAEVFALISEQERDYCERYMSGEPIPESVIGTIREKVLRDILFLE